MLLQACGAYNTDSCERIQARRDVSLQEEWCFGWAAVCGGGWRAAYIREAETSLVLFPKDKMAKAIDLAKGMGGNFIFVDCWNIAAFHKRTGGNKDLSANRLEVGDPLKARETRKNARG